MVSLGILWFVISIMLLFKFCDNVKIEVPKGINLNNLVDRLIKEIGFTK